MQLYYFFPLISAMIGWFTNFIAVKMLFYPREERNFVFFKLHGVFPKRKEVLAQRLGKVVAEELLSSERIREQVANEDTQEDLLEAVDKEVDLYLRNRREGFGSRFVQALFHDGRLEQLRMVIVQEIKGSIPNLVHGMGEKIADLDVEALVSEQVQQFDSKKVEDLLKSILQKELHFIELAGAILGFFIGVIQVLIILWQSWVGFLWLFVRPANCSILGVAISCQT